MFNIDSGTANLKNIDYDILEFLEYPKKIDEIENRFPGANITVKILELLDKKLIEEKNEKYVCKFHTETIKKIIADSKVPANIKKNFNFFLSQIDNPFVRQNILDTDARQKSDLVLSMITKSISQELTERELTALKLTMNALMDKLS